MRPEPTPSVNIPYLDGWRGLAILLVLQAHFLLGGGGRLGVTLFFALSGYLMGDLLFVKRVPITTFFVRRFSRIIPTFWCFTLMVALYAALFQPVPYAVPLDELAATLTFLRTYLPADVSIWADQWAIGHAWSLNVEEHAYLFLALLALLLRRFGIARRAAGFLLATVCVCLLMTCLYLQSPPAGASPWFARTECAALGLACAAAVRAARVHATAAALRHGHAALPVIGFPLALLCFTPWVPAWAMITVAPLLLAVVVNYLDRAPALLHRMLSHPVLRWFGVCSFSLYIWQQPFYIACQRFGLQRQLAGLLALALGTAAFHLLENPARKALNNWWDRRRQPVAPAPRPAELPIPLQKES